MYNVAIIGAGPAGIFSALEIVKLRPEWKVVLIEKGQKIEKRKCPIREGSPKCVNCKRCGLLCGWGGAGAFSDGKLCIYDSAHTEAEMYAAIISRKYADKWLRSTETLYTYDYKSLYFGIEYALPTYRPTGERYLNNAER